MTTIIRRSSRSTSRRSPPRAVLRPTAPSRFAWATTIAMTHRRDRLADARRAMPTRAGNKKQLLGVFHGDRRGRDGRACASSARATGGSRWCCSSSPTSASPAAFVFYDSLLPHVARGRTSWTACRPPATRSATWAAGCCSSSTCCGSRSPSGSASPTPASATRLSFVSVAAWWVTVLDSAVPARARAARREAGERAGSVWAAAFGGSAAPCASCAGTSRRSCSCWRSSSTTTASAPSSAWRRSTAQQIGIAQQHLIFALVLVQFVGIPFAFLFGRAGGVDRRQARRLHLARRLRRRSACSATT